MNKTTGKNVIKLYLLFSSWFDQFVIFNSGLLKYIILLEVVSTFLKHGKIFEQQLVKQFSFLFVVEILVLVSIKSSFKYFFS